MRNVLLGLLIGVAIPTGVLADACPGCRFTMHDAQDLASVNFGTFPGITKEIFVSIRFDPTQSFDRFSGLEFSVSGLTNFLVNAEMLPPATVSAGTTIAAPADTTTGEGGLAQSWSVCQESTHIFAKLTLISPLPVGNNVVLRVRRRFPPTDANTPAPAFYQCDSPNFTVTSVEGGCFVINPNMGAGATIDGCLLTTAVAAETWSRVKQLYKD